MNITNKMKSILTLSVGLLFAHCGSDGTTTTIPFGNTSATSPFYVLSSSPAWNQYYVQPDMKTYSIRMSEEVASDQAILDANIQLVQDYDSANPCGGTPIPTTKSVTGSLINISTTGGVLENKNYAILLYQGLKSTSDHTLLENSQPFNCFYINFSTGGTVGRSVAGRPTVTMSRNDYAYNYYTGQTCFGVLLQFNESLGSQPTVTMEYRPGTLIPKNTINVYAYPINTFDNTLWQADLCDTIAVASTVTVKVPYFVDLSGETNDPAPDAQVSQDFSVVLGK